MPTIITLGSASAKSLGFALSSNYFISGITYNEGFNISGNVASYAIDFAAYALEVDALGNTTLFGYRGRSSSDAYVVRLVFDTTGNLTTKQAIYSSNPTGPNGPILGSVTDSAGNIYVSNYYINGPYTYTPTITKFNSAGTIIATTVPYAGLVTTPVTIGVRGGNLAIDSSGNIWQLLIGWGNPYIPKNASYTNTLIKYNSSLAVQGSGYSAGSSQSAVSMEYMGIDTSSPNKIIYGGTTVSYASPNYTNTSFYEVSNDIATPSTMSFAKDTMTSTIANTNTGVLFLSAGIDTSNNVYTLQCNINTGIITLFKFASSSTFQWGKQWPISITAAAGVYASAIKFDTAGNLYFTYLITRSVSSNSGTKTVTSIVIAKFTTSGSPVFFRELYCTTPSYSYLQAGTNVTVGKGMPYNLVNIYSSSTPSLKVQGDSLYISGIVDYVDSANYSKPYMFLFKVPTNGGCTQSFTVGSYDMVYANYNPTVTTMTQPLVGTGVPLTTSTATPPTTNSPYQTTITPTTLKRSL